MREGKAERESRGRSRNGNENMVSGEGKRKWKRMENVEAKWE